MSANSIVNAMNMIFDGFFAYAQSVQEERGLDDVEGLRQLWEENKEKIEDEMKKQLKEILPAKKTRTKKPKDAPKNPKSAYVIFCQEKRDEVKKANPEMIAKDIMKELGKLWKDTEEDDRKEYKEKAQEDKERYTEEMKNYVPSEDEETRKPKAKKPKNAPKNAKSAYIFYCQDERVKIKADHPDLDAKEVLKLLGVRWQETDEETKDKYKKMAEADKTRYAKEMETYVPSEEEEKKSRKPRAKKDKNAPKNVRSAYMFFRENRRDVIKKKNPDLKGKELTNKLTEQWNKIKDTPIAMKYHKMVDEDKKRYAKEMEEYKQKKDLEEDEDEELDEELEVKQTSEDEDDDDEEVVTKQTPEDIVRDIIDNFDGEVLNRKYIKEELKKRNVEIEKDELNSIIKKVQA